MNSYPTGAAERSTTRERIGRAAHLQAIANRLSIKCAGQSVVEQHAGEPGGCRNDGSTCLCKCHDQPAGQDGDG